jgi:arylsulfatase A-like enzyme
MPPNVQALADRGTNFTDYHAHFPLCCPSRVTTMAGYVVSRRSSNQD